MTIGKICNRDVVYVNRDVTVHAACKLMRHYHVGSLGVVDEIDGKRVPAGTEDHGVLETIEVMRFRGVRRMPIVEADGRLIGIVTIDDLLEVLAGELSDIARIVAREQTHEKQARA